MGDVIDMTARLARLHKTVGHSPEHYAARQAALMVKAEQRQADAMARKRDDWSRVVADYPAHADFIMAITQTFGKPKRVIVRTAQDTVLDSARYGA